MQLTDNKSLIPKYTLREHTSHFTDDQFRQNTYMLKRG
jgi:hypothetical protein